MITVVYRPSPFAEPYVADAPAGLSLIEIAGRRYDDLRIFLGDDPNPVPAEEWSLTYPADGATILLIRIPKGPMKALPAIFAAIAQATAAAAFAAGVSGSVFGIGTAALVGSGVATLATAGLAIGLTMLPSLIMPQPPTSSPQFSGGAIGARFLALTSGSNPLAKFDVIPKLYGTFRIEPPLAGGYYSEIQGQDQYLHILLCLGYGPIAIDGQILGQGYPALTGSTATSSQKQLIKIGNTPISSFGDISWMIGTPQQIADGKIYNKDVDEQQLSIAMDTSIQQGAYPDTFTMVAEPNPPAVTRTSAAGPDRIGVDLAFPSLYCINSNGITGRGGARFKIEVRKTGQTGWTLIKSDWDIIDYTYNPVRKNWTFDVPDQSHTGTWDVRLTRTHSFISGNKAVSINGTWTALRSVIRTAPWNYDTAQGGIDKVMLMALRVKATGRLNGRVDTISIVAQSVLPVYDPGTQTWTPTATNNPAWAYIDALKGPQCDKPLTDDQIDLTAIVNWANACAANGYEYNWYHNQQETLIQRIRAIATTGRAAWTLRDGKFSVVRDADFTPVQLISPRNSREFSFERRFPVIPHALRVRYINKDTWDVDERIVYDDGYSEANATRYELLETQGITSANQAWKEGRYFLAVLKLRPETYRVTMDIENLVLQRGDCALLGHDSLLVGLAYGRIVSISGNNVTVDELLTIESGKTYAIRIRRQDNTCVVSQISTPIGDTYTVTLASALSGIAAGDLFAFGEYGYDTILVKVSEVRYRTDLSAELTLVPAAPGVIDAESGTIPPWQPGIPPPSPNDKPPIPVILFLAVGGETQRLGSDGIWRADVNVAWSLPSSPVQVDQIDVQYWTEFEGSVSNPRVDSVSSDRSQYTITDIRTGATLHVQLRSRSVNGVYSDYSGEQTIVVQVATGPRVTASVVLTVTPVNPAPGDTVTLTATVSGYNPTGSVAFKDYTDVIGTISLSNGVAILTTTGLGLGTHELMAVYSGDNNNTAATSNLVKLVVGASWAGPPAAPSGLNALGDNFQIHLWWSNPYIGDYAVTEIWGSQTNNRSTAVKLGEIAGQAWTFTEYDGSPLTGGQTWYFWVRNRDTENLISNWTPNTTTGVAATVSASPQKYLDLLTNSITRTQLWDDLGGLVDNIRNQLVWKIDDDGWVSGFGLASSRVNGEPFSDFMIRANRISMGTPSSPASKTAVTSLTRSGTTATCNATAHGLQVNEWFVLQNVAESGWNGLHKVVSSTANSFTFTVPDTISATTTVQSGKPARYVFRRPDEIPISSLTRSGTTATATTVAPHGLSVGQWFMIMNATAGNSWNGSFKVTAVPNSTQVQFTVDNNGTTFPTPATAEAGQVLILNKANIPFIVLTRPTVIDGVTIPAGVFMNETYIREAVIDTLMVRDGAIVNAKIGNTIESATWTSSGGATGWQINKQGDIVAKGGSFQLYDANGNPVFVSGNLQRIFGNPNQIKNSGFESFFEAGSGSPTSYLPHKWAFTQGASHNSTCGTVQDGRADGNGVSFGPTSPWLLGDGTAYIYQPNGVTTGNDFLDTSDYIPVEVGKWYEGSVYSGAQRCTVGIYIAWFNSSKSYLSTSYGTTNASEQAGGSTLAAYKRLFVLAQAPVNAVYARLGFYKAGTNSGASPANSFGFFTRAKFAEAISQWQNAPTPWARDNAPSAIGGKTIQTYIESAAINTLYVKGQAITFPQRAQLVGHVTIPGGGSFGQLLSLTYPPSPSAEERNSAIELNGAVTVNVNQTDNFELLLRIDIATSPDGVNWTALLNSAEHVHKFQPRTSGGGTYYGAVTYTYFFNQHGTYWNQYIRYTLMASVRNNSTVIQTQDYTNLKAVDFKR
ncbi:MAG TPA: host specificity factor TipJ family phage tail protein [Methylococcus sp.]|nr:host specificity factor TipJ family phage tail protein [Methylococcus sp.]